MGFAVVTCTANLIQTKARTMTDYGSFNKNDSHRAIGSGTIKRYGLGGGGASLGSVTGGLKAQLSFPPKACQLMQNSWLLLQHRVCLQAAVFAAMQILD